MENSAHFPEKVDANVKRPSQLIVIAGAAASTAVTTTAMPKDVGEMAAALVSKYFEAEYVPSP